MERLFQFGPDGTQATEDFGRIDSLALDQQDEHIYVLDEEGSEGTLHKFGPDGNPVDFEGTSLYIDGNQITGLEPFEQDEILWGNQVAVSPMSKGIYITETDALRAFEADGEPAEFTAGPGAGTSEIPGFTELAGVTVDAEGSIYASDRGTDTVSVFASSGAFLSSFSTANAYGIGIDASGAVYVHEGFSTIKRFTPSVFPVSASTTYSGGTFITSPSRIVSFDLDRVNGDVYVLQSNLAKSWLRRYSSAGALVESFGESGTPTESSFFGGASEGIALWEQANEIAEGEKVKAYVGDFTFNSLGQPDPSNVAALGSKIIIGPPEVENTSALDVTADSARLRAWIDPNTAETTYRFEYGLDDCETSTCTSIPLGGASVGAGEDPVEVSHSIFGLQPDTTYHYRVVAENSLGPPTEGPVRAFTTQPLGLDFELIDSRVWEMVSPPDKRGAVMKGTKGGLIRAASDGEGLAYLSLGSIESDPQGNRALEFSPVLAKRDPDGWHSQDITSPNHEVTGVGSETEGEFRFYSPDISRGILMPRGGTLLSPQASERTPYLWQSGEPAVYTPLLTGKEGFENVPPGVEFGGAADDTVGEVLAVGATPDLDRVVLMSFLPVPLVEGLTVQEPLSRALYLWTAGQLRPISVLPVGEGGLLASEAAFGSNETTIQNAISEDGSRVFWGRLSQFGAGALYMRDTIAEETVRLDVVQLGAPGSGGANPVFQGASADGTVVFFTDSRRLTLNASPAERDLYRCEILPGSPTTGCASLTNLSAPLAGSGESAEVLGRVPGLGEDGTRTYFVARGVLDTVPNQYGDSALAGEPNLYAWEEGGEVRFVGTLAEADRATWGGSTLFGEASKLSAAASPSGRHLVFMSQRSLSGYANLEATNGKPVQEVFRYDAVTEDLDCISCNSFGSAPAGEELEGRPLLNPAKQYDGLQAAAVLPGAYKNEMRISSYRARTVLDNGRVFFNAFDSLVPADSNGEWDVYQWEPTGVGSCNASSSNAAIARAAGGCVSLLSSGTAEEESVFLDASETGEDAFFLTPARLSVLDEDKELDVYDARVNGVAATLQSNPECLGEACQPPATPPNDQTPASAAFKGPGNEKRPNVRRRCAKSKRQVRRAGKARCVPRKQARKGKARKAGRAGR